ncbi:MAG: GNAT family N-acetyltransferase [Gemmatimonadota bacterium]
MKDFAVEIRVAEKEEIGRLARLWYDSWQDAHARIAPVELPRSATVKKLEDRLASMLPSVRVVDLSGEPAGLRATKGDELYLLYLSAEARGSGVAAALLADAETRLSQGGVEVAWLACAIGNDRAARFYEKCGWHRVGTEVKQLETPNGNFPLEVWRYEKRLH